MGVKKDNLSSTWQQLGQHLDLDPPTKLDEQVYLGIKQTPVVIPQKVVREKNELYNEIFGEEVRNLVITERRPIIAVQSASDRKPMSPPAKSLDGNMI